MLYLCEMKYISNEFKLTCVLHVYHICVLYMYDTHIKHVNWTHVKYVCNTSITHVELNIFYTYVDIFYVYETFCQTFHYYITLILKHLHIFDLCRSVDKKLKKHIISLTKNSSIILAKMYRSSYFLKILAIIFYQSS